MDSRQRRQIILARQRLTAPADPETVCRDLNGLQAQFFPTPATAWPPGAALPWARTGAVAW